MDDNQFREAAHATIEEIISFFTNLHTLPVSARIQPGYLQPLLPSSAPEEPEPFSSTLADTKSHIVPGITHWQHPNFMAFFPAHTSYPSILGELLSATFSAPAFNWICSPACTELETVVMDWVAKALGLDEGWLSQERGGGVIQGSASEAVVTAMVAARERSVRQHLEKDGLWPPTQGESEERVLEREDRAMELRGKMVALGSEQSHSCTHKAANILGVRFRTVRAGLDGDCEMRGDTLRAKLDECEAKGLIPFYVTATLGTTGTCAVDDFEGIAAVKRDRPGVWVHVDAAYAGTALICPEYREMARAKWLSEFDSFNFNMHKWLLVNFDASCLFVRDRGDLTSALGITPSYLVNPDSLKGLVTDYRDWQIPLGRRFRALKVWFVLRTYGLEKMRKMVREHVRLGEVFAGLVMGQEGRDAGLWLVKGPKFALNVIRCVVLKGQAQLDSTKAFQNGNPGDEMNGFGNKAGTPTTTGYSGGDIDEVASNDLTKETYELINSRGKLFLTSAVIDGVYCVRVVSANERANEKNVRQAFATIVETLSEVKAAKGA